MPPRLTGIVLAAGLGTRMGGPKAILVVDGERLVDRAVRLLHSAGCDRVIAVLGTRLTDLDADQVLHPSPADGMRSSLALGVAAALGVPLADQPDAIAVLLVDQPGLTESGTRAVVQAWQPGRVTTGQISAADRATRVHPVVMAPTEWQQAIDLADPDEGARRFLAAYPDRIEVIDVPGDPIDLDTPEDLRAWGA